MIEDFFASLNDLLWGLPMIILLVGTHLFMTFRTKGVQRRVFQGIRLSITSDDAGGDINHFQALTTALASTIGTGNVVGVGTAIALGGPGAVLWTWLTGIFGIATKYAESYMAIKYRRKEKDGHFIGGAMIVLEHLNLKWLGVLFAIFCALCAFGIGCSVQSNAIVTAINNVVPMDSSIIGIVLVCLTAVVTFGGVKSISKVCEKLVPFMAIGYTLGCIYILIYNHAFLLQTIEVIVKAAFTPQAVGGGFVGSTILIASRYGIARGLFSNESGMGSSPIVSAASTSKNAVKQALIASTGTFWDTVVVCLLTGLVLVSSILGNPDITTIGMAGDALTTACFDVIPVIGRPLLVFGIVTFAFSTILGWSYYGERCLEYLTGTVLIKPYRILWLVVLYFGCVGKLDLVWAIADCLNALMAIPNIIAVLLLSKQVRKDTDYYLYGNHLDEVDPEVVQ